MTSGKYIEAARVVARATHISCGHFFHSDSSVTRLARSASSTVQATSRRWVQVRFLTSTTAWRASASTTSKRSQSGCFWQRPRIIAALMPTRPLMTCRLRRARMVLRPSSAPVIITSSTSASRPRSAGGQSGEEAIMRASVIALGRSRGS